MGITAVTLTGQNVVNYFHNGRQDIAIGFGSLEYAVGGNNNIAIGYRAGRSTTTGGMIDSNILIGGYTGAGLSTGDSNILIG